MYTKKRPKNNTLTHTTRDPYLPSRPSHTTPSPLTPPRHPHTIQTVLCTRQPIRKPLLRTSDKLTPALIKVQSLRTRSISLVSQAKRFLSPASKVRGLARVRRKR